MDPIIGIDLGTTHSVVAHMTDEGPRIIPNALGENLTPSVVAIDTENKLVVGRSAKELAVTQPDRCASLFKRVMGTDWTTQLGAKTFTPEELSSLVLRALREDAQAHLGYPVNRAVITVPAYFNDQQRKATQAAGRIAGFQVERIFNEPTSAALAYGFHESREDKKLLIFDLGGGTFDVSIVELFDGILEVKASCGETLLGGEDFTRTLAARVLERQARNFERAELDAPLLVARLLQQCEVAKCRLSRQESVAIRVPDRRGEVNEKSPTLDISRAQFEAWTQHILARVEMPLKRVLGDAKLQRKDIDEVLLVGGATRMPAVVQLVTRLFDKPPHSRINPDEVVGLGAAVQSGLIGGDDKVKDLVVTDVAPFTLGLEISKQFGSEHRAGYFLPLIHRNTTIPASRCEPLMTMAPNQTEILVKIYQGESRRVEQNLLLGEFVLKGIPYGPAGQQIEVRFTYDLNGVLEVEATIVKTGQKMTHVITRHARGLSEADVARAVREMARLKTHPRDESVNRHILRRAERLYAELPSFLRDQLSLLLDGMEHALALQDPQVIAAHREALYYFLNQHDPNPDEAAEE